MVYELDLGYARRILNGDFGDSKLDILSSYIDSFDRNVYVPTQKHVDAANTLIEELHWGMKAGRYEYEKAAPLVGNLEKHIYSISYPKQRRKNSWVTNAYKTVSGWLNADAVSEPTKNRMANTYRSVSNWLNADLFTKAKGGRKTRDEKANPWKYQRFFKTVIAAAGVAGLVASAYNLGQSVNAKTAEPAEMIQPAGEARRSKDVEVKRIERGDTIWDLEKEKLRKETGKEPTDMQVLNKTYRGLELNDLTWKSARKIQPGQIVLY
jgi:hypothetical protein